MEFHPRQKSIRSQHSTWEYNIWLDKDQHSTLQFNFLVLNAIVKTLDFNFISESSTLNFVHQHSSLLINIALDTCAFRERWTLNHQVNWWLTKDTNPAKNQSRSQHSTLQFNFVVLNTIVKTLDFNFISKSSTLDYVHRHSSSLINIALDTCAFREIWTLNHQVGCWDTKGVPIPP